MLEEIRITSLGVIESSTLELGPGLTVITGETGAGKTMLVTALGLLLGGRADTGTVRTGAKAARVEGVVRVDDLAWFATAIEEAGGAVEDDHVVLARNVSAEGRSRAFAGGASVPVSVLAELAEPLVAVHGQSDQHRLLAPRAQRDALDRFAGDRVAKPLARYVALRARLLDVEAELTEVTRAARERAREADLLRFGLDEIAAVEPRPGEDTDLAAEEARLGYADTLRAAAERAREALSSDQGTPDALAAAAEARTALDSVRDHDTGGRRAGRPAGRAHLPVVGPGGRRRVVRLRARDRPRPAGGRLGAAGGADGAHPQVRRHHRRGARLGRAVVGQAPGARRHGRQDRAAPRGGRVRARRPGRCRHRADRRPHPGSHQARRPGLRRADPAGDARRSRHRGGAPARRGWSRPARCSSARRWLRFGSSGVDEVEIELAANAGSPSRPLAKGASGGELSRVMLAIEVALAGTSPVPTFVFDEVDAGVGGRAAVEVGRRLAELARTAQVLVVTHLPQVAAYADRHVVVEKSSDGTITTSGLTVLDPEARERELSRMFAGVDESDTALAHARELLETAAPGRALS